MSNTDDRIERVLEWASEHPDFDTTFIESLQKSYEANGCLTARQEEALENIMYKWRIED